MDAQRPRSSGKPSRAAARRRRAAQFLQVHRDQFEELQVALRHWLTPVRVDELGRQVAAFLAEYRDRTGAGPAWGEIARASGVVERVPFAAPEGCNAAARQRWRNASFHAVMQACQARGWVEFGKRHPMPVPGWRWKPPPARLPGPRLGAH
jgi:hypothetical protein